MIDQDIEPLEPVAWLATLDSLARQVPIGEAALPPALRRGFHLVQLAPRPLRHILGSSVGEAEFEALLARGALLQAAEALVGQGLASSIRTAASGLVQAEVRFTDGTAVCRASGPTAALALFAAWCACLRTLSVTGPAELEPGPEAPADQPVDAPTGATSQVPRRFRSAPRPRLTEH
jgi:hypothetical protein